MAKVLIAEDEVRISAFIEKGLRKYGFETVSVENGLDALNKLQSQSFDMLLLDLGLPGKDGLTVLRELRQAGANLPVIIVTARDEERDRRESMELGASDYVSKPFRFNELLSKVQQHLNLSSLD